jgi:ribosome recycling factor
MTTKELFAVHKTQFDGVIDFYKMDIASIRTGRATPALVEDIEVEHYGQRMKIKELASIVVPEPRALLITPWDSAAVGPIENAIRKSSVGLQPIVDGKSVRISIPSLSEERRKEFIKALKHKAETARIKIRKVREDIWEKIQNMQKDGAIREDDKFKSKEDLQKMVDEHNKKIEELEKKKEEELWN